MSIAASQGALRSEQPRHWRKICRGWRVARGRHWPAKGAMRDIPGGADAVAVADKVLEFGLAIASALCMRNRSLS